MAGFLQGVKNFFTDEDTTDEGDGPDASVSPTGGLAAANASGIDTNSLVSQLQTNLQKLQNEKQDKSAKWLALAAALGSPTKTGTLGETAANAASALAKYRQEEKTAQEERQNKILSLQLGLAKVGATAGKRHTGLDTFGRLRDLDTGEVIEPAVQGKGAPTDTLQYETGKGADLMEKYPNLKGLKPDDLYKVNRPAGDVTPIKVETEKPILPAPALARQTALVNEAGQLFGTAQEASTLMSLVNTGDLKLGPIENTASRAKNLAGLSDPNAENFAKLERFVNASVNSILNIAKGPQTEGDAIRAKKQILSNLNDPKIVASGLADLRRIMLRELSTRDAQIQGLYRNYRAEPVSLWEAIGVDAPSDYTAPKFQNQTSSATSRSANMSKADAIRAILKAREAGQ